MNPEDEGVGHTETAGGDPVCWLHQLCPDCGAVPDADTPGRCWRCGTLLTTDE